MRPSKFRLPLSTDATTRSRASTSAATSSGSGPLLPMHVVHPYPTRLNPSWSRYLSRPAFRRYSVTTFEPGARLVFTHGWRASPRSTAFFASRPAAIITLGFEVFVQLVIAAITTEPWRIENFSPLISTGMLACRAAWSSGSIATTDGDNCDADP